MGSAPNKRQEPMPGRFNSPGCTMGILYSLGSAARSVRVLPAMR